MESVCTDDDIDFATWLEQELDDDDDTMITTANSGETINTNNVVHHDHDHNHDHDHDQVNENNESEVKEFFRESYRNLVEVAPQAANPTITEDQRLEVERFFRESYQNLINSNNDQYTNYYDNYAVNIDKPVIQEIEQIPMLDRKREGSVDSTSLQPNKKRRLKTLKVSARALRIGTWQRVAKNQEDVVTKCYYAKKRIIWELLENGLKCKIEIHWDQISAMRVITTESAHTILEIELREPPSFFHEKEPKPGRHTLWDKAADFTDGNALTYRIHSIEFSPGFFDKPYKELLKNVPQLELVSQAPFPTPGSSPLFSEPIDRDVFENTYSTGCDGAKSPIKALLHISETWTSANFSENPQSPSLAMQDTEISGAASHQILQDPQHTLEKPLGVTTSSLYDHYPFHQNLQNPSLAMQDVGISCAASHQTLQDQQHTLEESLGTTSSLCDPCTFHQDLLNPSLAMQDSNISWVASNQILQDQLHTLEEPLGTTSSLYDQYTFHQDPQNPSLSVQETDISWVASHQILQDQQRTFEEPLGTTSTLYDHYMFHQNPQNPSPAVQEADISWAASHQILQDLQIPEEQLGTTSTLRDHYYTFHQNLSLADHPGTQYDPQIGDYTEVGPTGNQEEPHQFISQPQILSVPPLHEQTGNSEAQAKTTIRPSLTNEELRYLGPTADQRGSSFNFAAEMALSLLMNDGAAVVPAEIPPLITTEYCGGPVQSSEVFLAGNIVTSQDQFCGGQSSTTADHNDHVMNAGEMDGDDIDDGCGPF